jgi:hypothetical protein
MESAQTAWTTLVKKKRHGVRVDSLRTYLNLQEKNYYIKILIIYCVNNPGPHAGGGRKVATVAALVEVALPPKLPNTQTPVSYLRANIASKLLAVCGQCG